MEVARNEHGALITLEQARTLAVLPPLWCPGEVPDGSECGAKAWATALHSSKKSAAFAAHHRTGCDEDSGKTHSQPGDAGHDHAQGNRPAQWRMRLGAELPSSGPDGRRRPDPRRPGSLTRRYRTDPAQRDMDTADQRSFSTMLLNLIAGTMPQNLELLLGGKKPVPAEDIIVAARDADSATWLNRDLIIWGTVAGYRTTRWGGLMIRFEKAANSVAILVDKQSLERLGITDPSILLSRDVIAYGRYTKPEESRWFHVHAVTSSVAFNPRVVRRRR